LTSKKPSGSHIKLIVDEQTIWRICTDYRQLNKAIKKNDYPLPNAIDQIQRTAGHNYYCFIDLKDGFWRIGIAEKDREKTAFTTFFDFFEWIHMPFGLYNAPATFQALIEEMMEDFEFVASLLNDIAVWGNILNQLYNRIRLVLRKITKYGMIFNIRKSVIFVIKEIFLKLVILAAEITANEDKMAAIWDQSEPSITTKVRAFVNAANYFRHLIEKYSIFSGFLIDFTGDPKGQPLKLEPLAKAAWEKIRETITTLLIIKPFE
jgi:hypothetical protein